MPVVTTKFKKQKHKVNPWVTTGIMRSIKNRNKMYRKLMTLSPESVSFTRLHTNLKTYNCIIRKLMRNAKISYFHEQFSINKNDCKKSWKLINALINGFKSKSGITNFLL